MNFGIDICTCIKFVFDAQNVDICNWITSQIKVLRDDNFIFLKTADSLAVFYEVIKTSLVDNITISCY